MWAVETVETQGHRLRTGHFLVVAQCNPVQKDFFQGESPHFFLYLLFVFGFVFANSWSQLFGTIRYSTIRQIFTIHPYPKAAKLILSQRIWKQRSSYCPSFSQVGNKPISNALKEECLTNTPLHLTTLPDLASGATVINWSMDRSSNQR